MTDSTSEMILVGRVSGLYGIKGWIKVKSDTQPVDNILRYSPWYIRHGNQWLAHDLLDGRVHGQGLVAHLSDCPDRDAAAGLQGSDIAIMRSQLVSLGPDEFYWQDLIGLHVYDSAAQLLGTVRELLETGANDVLVLTPTSGTEDILIPYIKGSVIQQVDIEAGTMTVDWDPDY